MKRQRWIAAAGACAAGALGIMALGGSPATASTAAPELHIVSRDNGAAGTVSNPLGGFEPSVNGDGRFVAFESASNFGGQNPDNLYEVWLRDRLNNTTTLVSRATGAAGAPANNGPVPCPNCGSGGSWISADGRYVVFDSNATNLVPGYTGRNTNCTGGTSTNNEDDVYLRDTVAGTTKLISHKAGMPNTVGNDISSDPAISADGSTITYASSATDISSETQSNASCNLQVLVYKVATGTTIVASRASNVGLVLGAEGNSFSDSRGVMSRDGNLVAFSSDATNLTTDSVSNEEVYVRNISAGTTTLVSRASNAGVVPGAPANHDCSHPGISLDGTLVVMSCEATNMGVASGNQNVYLRNLSTGTTTVESLRGSPGAPSTDASAPVISGDGSTVAFETTDTAFFGTVTPRSGDSDDFTQIVVRDIASGTWYVASRVGASGAVGNDEAEDVAVNTDGSAIAFEGDASNLTADSPQSTIVKEVFVRGAVPTPPTPTPTPTPTPSPVPVPSTGGAQEQPGGPVLLVAALTVAFGAAVVGRRGRRE